MATADEVESGELFVLPPPVTVLEGTVVCGGAGEAEDAPVGADGLAVELPLGAIVDVRRAGVVVGAAVLGQTGLPVGATRGDGLVIELHFCSESDSAPGEHEQA